MQHLPLHLLRRPGARRLAVSAALAVAPAWALAAANDNQSWSGSTTEGWEANTISSVVVHDSTGGNPAGSLATRRDGSFDIGFTSGNLAALSGSFGSTPWTVSFDLKFDAGSFDGAALRYRYQDSGFNGWFYALSGPFVTDASQWVPYSVSFDPTWDDATAMAHGWTQESGAVVGFAQTLGNAYRTEIRLSPSTDTALAHLDNFSAMTAPVPEPGTWALTGLGLLGLAVRARRRA